MIASLRFAWTMVRVTVHVARAAATVGGVFPFCSHATRQRLIRRWSAGVLAVCRIELRIVGLSRHAAGRDAIVERLLQPGGGGAMLVMNHVSWVDIFIVHSLRAARFVAKAEIARWPLLGYLTDRTGALFIERGKRHAVREVNHRAAELLRHGELIGMFPEGAVGDGRRLLPFHANLIQPAIDARVPIVVAGLRYRDVDGRSTTAIDYTGDITLLQSIVRIARHGPLVAELHVIDALDGGASNRHQVARTARALIAEALAFDDDVEEAAEGVSTVIVVPDDVSAQSAAGKRPGPPFESRDELL